MSVVVELTTMIIRRDSLDAKYPGGSQQFLDDVTEAPLNARWACGDGHLVAVGVEWDGPDSVMTRLSELGLHHTIGDAVEPIDIAFARHLEGLTTPCSWLSFARRPDRLSMVWLSSEDPGEFVQPRRWAPVEYTHLARCAEDRTVKLAEEDGVEYWLDHTTGAMYDAPVDPLGDTPGPLMTAVCRALDKQDWTYAVHSARIVVGSFIAGVLRCEFEARVQENIQWVTWKGLIPVRVPEDNPLRSLLEREAPRVRSRYEGFHLKPDSEHIRPVLISKCADIGEQYVVQDLEWALREFVSMCRDAEDLAMLAVVDPAREVANQPVASVPEVERPRGSRFWRVADVVVGIVIFAAWCEAGWLGYVQQLVRDYPPDVYVPALPDYLRWSFERALVLSPINAELAADSVSGSMLMGWLLLRVPRLRQALAGAYRSIVGRQ